MAATFDSASTASYSASTGTGLTLTWQHTIGSGSDRLLVVAVGSRIWNSGATFSVTSVTYNGTSLTQWSPGLVATRDSPRRSAGTIFYALDGDLPSGGTYDVVVTYSVSALDSGDYVTAGAMSFAGVGGQSAPEATNSWTATDPNYDIGTFSTNITTQTSDALVVDVVVCDWSVGSVESVVTETGQTRRFWSKSSGSSLQFGGSSKTGPSTPGSTAMGWDLVDWGDEVHLLAAFQTESAGPPPLSATCSGTLPLGGKARAIVESPPTIVGQGSVAAVTTGNLTVTLPSHQANDLLVVTTVGWVPNTTSGTNTIAAPSGWTKLDNATLVTGGLIDGEWAIFWRRAASGSESNPVFTRPTGWDTGTDTCWAGRAYVIRHVATGAVWADAHGQSALHSTANQSWPAITISSDLRLAVAFLVSSDDQAAGAAPSGWTAGTAATTTTGTDAGFQTFRQVTGSSTSATTSATSAPAQGRYIFFTLGFIPSALPTDAAGKLPLAGTAAAEIVQAGPQTLDGECSGALPLTGTAAATLEAAAAASGTMPLTGSATAGLDLVAATTAGPLPMSGTAAAGLVLGASASGTQPLDGSASAVVEMAAAASGGLPLAGSAAATLTMATTASGGLPLSGSAAATLTMAAAGSGTLPLAGSAAAGLDLPAAASGGLQLAGSADATIVVGGQTLDATCSGTLPTAGAAAAVLEMAATAAGGLGTVGQAAAVVEMAATASGLLDAIGRAAAVIEMAATAAGGLGLAGSAAADIIGAQVLDATCSGTIQTSGTARAALEMAATAAGVLSMVGAADAILMATPLDMVAAEPIISALTARPVVPRFDAGASVGLGATHGRQSIHADTDKVSITTVLHRR